MTKPMYVHLKLSGPTVLGTTYANHYLTDDLKVDGKYVASKYLLVDRYLGPGGKGWEYSVYEVSIDAQSSSRPKGLPGDSDAEKLTYTDPDSGEKFRWAWATVYVSDTYEIPAGLDRTGLNGPVTWSTEAHSSIDFGSLSFDGSKLTLGGYSFDQLKQVVLDNVTAFLESGMKKSGYGGLLTGLQNVAAVRDFMLNGPGKAIDDLVALAKFSSDPNATPAQIAELENRIFSGITKEVQDAFDKAVLVPNNPVADQLAHQLIRGTGIVGNGMVINGGFQLDLEVGIRGTDLSFNVGGSANWAYAVGGAGDDTMVGQAARSLMFGGAGNDTFRVSGGTNAISGGSGDDTVVIGGGSNLVLGGSGIDTVAFSGSISNYTGRFSNSGNAEVYSSANTNRLFNVERIKFADGTVDLTTNSPLIDPFYYDSKNRDVFAAGARTDTHYNDWGWNEGRDPNAYFSTSGYLLGYDDIRAAHTNPLAHYDQYGWKEGRDPSAKFDTQLYLARNPDVAAAGVNPLTHYLTYGQFEGRQAFNALGRSVSPNGFDAEYYLLANPDVATTRVDPWTHFETYGWREGRDPNGWFDTKGYLAHYADVAAANVNPFDHFLSSGWREGRDPSATFSTNTYLSRYTDVQASGNNPLVHFLQYGAMEGRFSGGTTSWAAGATPLTIGTTVNASIDGPGDKDPYSVKLDAGHRYVIQFVNRPEGSIDVATLELRDSVFGLPVFNATTARVLAPPPGVVYIAPQYAENTFGFSASQTGIYKLTVANGHQDAGGSYAMVLMDVTDKPARSAFRETTDIGGTRATAKDIGTGIAGEHSFTASGATSNSDHDIYKFKSPGGQIEISASDPSLLLQFHLSNESGIGGWLTGLRIVGATETSLIVDVDPGTYYLDVNSTAPTSYSIDFFF